MEKLTMKMFAVMACLMIVPMVFGADEPPQRNLILYGQVLMSDGATQANGASYTISTFSSGGMIQSTQTGAVGDLSAGYIYNDQNTVTGEGDSIVVQVTLLNESATWTHTVTSEDFGNSEVIMPNLILGLVPEYVPPLAKEKAHMPRREMSLSKVRFVTGDTVKEGEEVRALVSIGNKVDDKEMEGVRSRMIGMGVCDLYDSVGPFDLSEGEETTRILIADEVSGDDECWIRFVSSNDNVKRVKHRVITII